MDTPTEADCVSMLDRPRIVITALRGGSGKTILSIGVIGALADQGTPVTPFKKGPDYIDAGWLSLAAGRPCYNLDTFLIPPAAVHQSFIHRSRSDGVAVIEGNRGLYDGIETTGSTSTAELAKLLDAPLIMCIDGTKTTRTMAAVVAGCRHFDEAVQLKGVVLNRVAGPRHEAILTRSIETHCDVPVLGAIPKLRDQQFPERHMGLIPTPEHAWAGDAVASAVRIARQYLDLEAIEALARSAPPMPIAGSVGRDAAAGPARLQASLRIDGERPRIGIIRDAAFQFYYPENLEALERAGADLVQVSPLAQPHLPPLDGLYLGGGFPETHVAALAGNDSFRRELKSLAEGGLPIYAECGGLMYLGDAIELEGTAHPMVGLLPMVCGLSRRPQGHGYTVLRVELENPFFPVGTEIRGHEFHYSRVTEWQGDDGDLVFRMQRGAGFRNGRDGLRYKNVLALYTHMHALGTPGWAPALVSLARAYARKKRAAG